MSKYNNLWKYVEKENVENLKLTFDQIHEIIGLEIDHSFLTYKKELNELGYEVGKISIKEKTVEFKRID